MDWQHLLSAQRLGTRETDSKESKALAGNESGQGLKAQTNASEKRSPFNQDYGRVLYSSAFRRLQDKTQVFPLGRNDYVRTRLTHSLEVSNVGRSLAVELADIIRQKEGRDAESLPLEGLGDIVAAACLAHDIGNPPFGHSGEEAIEFALANTDFDWFKFEGNAQGFRLLSRTCDPIHEAGLDLTAATLGAFTKYPCTCTAKRSMRSVSCKKFGINASELDIFRRVADICGLPELAENVWARHPLAFLMEAADDISYLIADMEDSFVSGLLSYEDAAEQLFNLGKIKKSRKKIKENREKYGEASAIRYARAVAVGTCIKSVSKAMKAHYSDMLAGRLNESLLKVSSIKGAYEQVQEFSSRHIYNDERVVRVEITGSLVISKLMELFLRWVEKPDSPFGRKLGGILHANDASAQTEQDRFFHVVDCISAMTDSYALQTYRNLFGMAGV